MTETKKFLGCSLHCFTPIDYLDYVRFDDLPLGKLPHRQGYASGRIRRALELRSLSSSVLYRVVSEIRSQNLHDSGTARSGQVQLKGLGYARRSFLVLEVAYVANISTAPMCAHVQKDSHVECNDVALSSMAYFSALLSGFAKL